MRLAMILALGVVGAAYAESEMVTRAKETLQRIKDQRAQREVQATPSPQTWGHHLKEPEIIEEIKASTPETLPRPDIKPVGTIAVWGGLKVIVGNQAYGVGEEVLLGWRVKAIVGKRLLVEHEFRKVVHEYLIP